MVYRHKNARLSFPMHLFDAMVKPILLYGSEVWAGKCKWGMMETVARQFYKSMLGQSGGTVSCGMELMVGRHRVEDDGKTNMLCYWRRLTYLKEDRIARVALEHQVELANQTIDCWGLEVKKELDRLGLSYMWRNQSTGELSRKSFRRLIRLRIGDQRLTQQREEARNKISAMRYERMKLETGLDSDLKQLHDFHGRRSYVRFMLKSDGALLIRHEEKRQCGECLEEIIRNVFVHRVMECKELQKQRAKIEKSDWFVTLNALPQQQQIDYLHTSVDLMEKDEKRTVLRLL